MGRLLDEDIVIDALVGISGSKSIEELTEECEVYQSDNRCWSGGVYGAIRAIKNLPSAQPEQQWIPCSERLPEEGQNCLVCDKGSIGIDTYIGHGNPYNWKWYVRDYEAWIPLPEPYMKGDTK